jgi:peptidoglycan/xylan/chitin deacetylase (PgdA/CDA1 family)
MGGPEIGARRTIALMYHAVGDGTEAGADPHYTVDLARLGQQLALCGRLGGGAVSARDWIGGRPGVIVTFDDGHESNYRLAFPFLAGSGVTADFFVNPAQVGTAGFASWAELAEMARAGMSIQSHGLDHRRYFTELAPDRLRADLARAKSEIEDRVGRPVTLLAPPGGRCPAGLADIAREAGYLHVLDSRPAVIRRDRGSPFGRFAVTSRLDDRTLESWLRGGRGRLRTQARHALLHAAKRALGDALYERVRRRLLGSSTS